MLLALSMQMFAGQACFASGRCVKAALKASPVPKWRNGRRRGFKIPRLNGRAGSSPALGTSKYNGLRLLLCFPLFSILSICTWRSHFHVLLYSNQALTQIKLSIFSLVALKSL